MRTLISLLLVLVVALGVFSALRTGPVGAEAARRRGELREDRVNFGRYYDAHALEQTGAANVVTSVVITYRGLDTLGEVTVLFIAALGLAAVLSAPGKKREDSGREPASLVVHTGCRFLFPLIVLFGTYVFVHGHLTPGGGFQGGAIIASGLVLIALGCREREPAQARLSVVESFSGLFFVVMGLAGLVVGGSCLVNFLPAGTAFALFSAGVIPLIYVAIGLKVGSELGGIVGNLAGEAE